MIEDVRGLRGEPIEEIMSIQDGVLVKGLSIEREKNKSPEDYQVWKDEKDMVR